MVKRLILHIGFPKTGSSSLQKYLSENRELLQKEYGICYPLAYTNFKKSHRYLDRLFASNLRRKLNLKLVAKDILHEANGAETVIFSYEGWAEIEFDVSRLGKFLQHLDVKDVHIIGYVREHLDFIQSLWRERIHFIPHFATPFFNFSETEQLVHNARIPAMIRNMETVARVDLVWYDKSSLRNENVISDFCYRIGIGEDNLPRHDSNPSIGGNLLLYKLMQNKIFMRNNLERDKFRAQKIMIYDKLKNIASERKNFQSAFFIPKLAANKFRRKSDYNKFFMNKIGPIKLRSFTAEPRFPDWVNLSSDFEIIFESFGGGGGGCVSVRFHFLRSVKQYLLLLQSKNHDISFARAQESKRSTQKKCLSAPWPR